jgi:hypothetical protein
MTVVASMKAYSKSALRARSCDCRWPAFATPLKKATWTLWVDGTCSRETVSRSDMFVG